MTKTNKPLLFQAISIRTILPSVVTLLAFISGLSSIKFALAGKWEFAVAAILFAGIFDGLDGHVARLLNSTSRFGAELDSLSDVVAFGVAPAIVLYLWSLESIDRVGWAASILYASAMALRLARFNARLDADNDPRKRFGFLTGIPAPVGAALALAPMMVDFSLADVSIKAHAYYIAPYVIVIALLLVSTLPTVSLKAIRIKKEYFVLVMLVIAAIITGLFVHTWLVMLIIGVVYLVSLPICFVAYQKRLKQKGRP
ncbi:phosphatidylcholine/phosphatidylserine synthase [Kordiimonas sp. SCSIO 12610]|uniref:CDP-alcohol phosphatidyltransferase family protein n=1 Tax=Kordiimonas sp. SCSIO 12610 TaxID=2829597 RepID=UPI00210A3369|nr:phosphatidylcholine/phosphatidylserine synthase [Kordiimonas sp. SCSIO 12610]UTW53801.1 phosphatidylcholine/phosphatidylserine synthase [Kordiimonas sp. SCSIO 12610]